MSSGTLSPGAASEKMPCLVRHLLLNNDGGKKAEPGCGPRVQEAYKPPQDIESKKITGVQKRPQVCRFLGRQDKGENGKELNRAA